MPDISSIGRRGDPYVVPVERGKVREMARATRARHSCYLTDERTVVPPTTLAAAAFWLGPRNHALGDGDLDWARTMHAGQEYVFHGPPPRAGDVLTAQERVEDVHRKQGRRGGTLTFTVLVTEYRDADGRLVAEARKTLVETSQAAR